MVQANNQIVVASSNSAIMANTLMGFEARLEEAAMANIAAQAGEGFTAAEVHAMCVIEELKLINDMDLAAVLLRGKLLKQIEDEGLWSHHPGQYANMAAMARDQGISLTELTRTWDLVNVVFPYMENVLGIHVSEVWEAIGKSNFGELVPVIKAMITGENSERPSTNEAIQRILQETENTAREAGQSPTHEDVVAAAVTNLLHDGSALTNRQLQERIRPDRTTAIQPTVIQTGGRRIVIVDMDEDQYLALLRKLKTFMVPQDFTLPEGGRARANQAARIPAVSYIRSLTED